MEETIEQAAWRETMEEARANVTIESLYAIFNLPDISQVYLLFRAQMVDEKHSPSPESVETKLFEEREIPWDSIAFTTVRRTLEMFIEDRKSGHFPVRIENIDKDPLLRHRARSGYKNSEI